MPLYQVTLPMLEQLLIPTLDLKKKETERERKREGDFSDKSLNRLYSILTLPGLIPINLRKNYLNLI